MSRSKNRAIMRKQRQNTRRMTLREKYPGVDLYDAKVMAHITYGTTNPMEDIVAHVEKAIDREGHTRL